MDDHGPYRLLPYRTLAGIWGCSTEAAQERVRRNKWPKQPGNGREVLVRVPLTALESVGHDLAPSPTDVRQSVKAQREAEVQALGIGRKPPRPQRGRLSRKPQRPRP